MQFSIAFLLWLTAACAFVLGIAVWTPCFFNPILAVGIVTIATIAYRKGKRAFRSSFAGCLILTSVSFVDWLIHVVRLPPCPIQTLRWVYFRFFCS